MRKLYFILSMILICAMAKAQVIEPEFVYECGVLESDSTLTICEKQNAKMTGKAGASLCLTGIGKVKVRYQVAGSHSNVRFKKSSKITLICRSASNLIDPNQVIKLYSLESKSKYRRVEIAQAGTFTGFSAMGTNIAFKATKYGQSSYKIEIENLPEGEYAVSVLNPMLFNCFAID